MYVQEAGHTAELAHGDTSVADSDDEGEVDAAQAPAWYTPDVAER